MYKQLTTQWLVALAYAIVLTARLVTSSFFLPFSEEHAAAAAVAAEKKSAVKGDWMRPGISAAEVLEAKGYVAKEFYITTQDGYIINLTRGTNPLINKGEHGLEGTLPIIFLQGSDIVVSGYVANALGVKPRDFRKKIDLQDEEVLFASDGAALDGATLVEQLKHDPSVRSLPFLAMNFGYETWFLERRGYGRSNRKVGHEKRTLLDALKAVPEALLKNGFSLTSGQEAHRPRGKKSDDPGLGVDKTKGSLLDKDSVASFWRELVHAAVSLDNLVSDLTNLKKVEKDFIHTFDPDYWNFCLDEVARYDLPEAIDFILEKSGKPKLHAVGLSSGGAIIMLAAAEQPELATKIASSILWAPAVILGSKSDIVYELSLLTPIFQTFSGPLPLVFMSKLIINILQNICSSTLSQRTVCLRIADFVFGYSGDQSQITQANIATLVQPMMARELFHLGQMAHTRTPCKYNWSTPLENKRYYGQPEAPCYDLASIKLDNIHVFQGNSDALVSYVDIEETVSHLTVPAHVHYLNETGLYFNHAGSLIHLENGRLIIAPSLLEIARVESKLNGPNELKKKEKKDLEENAEDWHGEIGDTSFDKNCETKISVLGGTVKTEKKCVSLNPKLKSKITKSESGNEVTDFFL